MKQPNFLFLFPDQHRGDWMPYSETVSCAMGMDPLPLKMPNIRKLMSEGVTFTRAVTPSPLCAPARACLAAGLRYHRCRVPSNGEDYPLDLKTFYTVLREGGYRVGGVGKFDLHKPTLFWGLDGWIGDLEALGFTDGIDNAGKWDGVRSGAQEPQDPYLRYLHDNGFIDRYLEDMSIRAKDILASHATKLPDEAYCDNWLTRNGLQLIRDFPEDRPWFLQVNFTGPHAPWDVTAQMQEPWKDVCFPLPVGWGEQDQDRIVKVRQNYAAMVENIDRNCGLLINEVKKRGELENTVIIYSSDHGEMLGDHRGFNKSRPERASVHIPLIVSGPEVRHAAAPAAAAPAGTICDGLVELQDLTNTFMDLAGLEMPEAEESLSLVPILKGGNAEHRPCQVSALDGWSMISNGRYKLIVADGDEERFYDLEVDPWETVNLASENQEIVKRMKEQLVREHRDSESRL